MSKHTQEPLNPEECIDEAGLNRRSSKNISLIEDTLNYVEIAAAREQKRQEVLEKEVLVREKKVQVDNIKYTEHLKDIQKFQAEKIAIEGLNLDNLSPEYLASSHKDQDQYLEGAKYRLRFILPCFDSVVPFFPKNVLLCGAISSNGKTHAACEIVATIIRHSHPGTGKPCRALIITNEETRGSIYARVCFLLNGWRNTRLDLLTQEQRQVVSEFQKDMELSRRLVVVDNAHPDISQLTTSIEGFESILNSIYKNENEFDVIIVDYFQKIRYSKVRQSINTVDALTRVNDIIEEYRKKLNIPIVVMAQLRPNAKDKEEFEARIKERRSIFETATFACEIKIDRKNYRTNFYIEKNRSVPETVGKLVPVGFDQTAGNYVEITPLFERKVKEWKARNIPQSAEEILNDDELRENSTPED